MWFTVFILFVSGLQVNVRVLLVTVELVAFSDVDGHHRFE